MQIPIVSDSYEQFGSTSLSRSLELGVGGIVVLGAGNIGRTMALQFALGGFSTVLIDKEQQAIENARRAIVSRLETAAVLPTDKDVVADRITFLAGTVENNDAVREVLHSAVYVVEALPENPTLKSTILSSLDGICPPTTPITTTSSSLTISELLSDVKFPQRFLNTHPLQNGMAPIEIMPSEVTDPVMTQQIVDLFSEIGMVPVMVNKENVGFIFNIVWRRIKQQALNLIENEVATPADLDRIWMMAFKTDKGPFAIMDLVGLQVVLDVERRYFALSGKEEDAPPRFLERMVQEGKLGVSTQEGFYRYPNPLYLRPGFLELGSEVEKITRIRPVRESLLGSWRLESFTAEISATGETFFPMGESAHGKLMYAPDGNMSVYLSPGVAREHCLSADPLGATTEERARAFTEFFSYFGRYRYHNGLMLHDIEACSFPNWENVTQIRHATFEGGRLILKTPPTLVKGQVGIQTLKWKPAR